MKLILTLVALAVAGVLVAAGVTLNALRALDAPGSAPVGSAAVSAVNTGRSLAYILDGDTGVVLVDVGSDPKAEALTAELAKKGRSLADVRAVVLTSAHPFSVAGLSALPNVPVYVGAEDRELVHRVKQAHAVLARTFDRWMVRGKRTNPFERVLPGGRFVIDGLTFDAVAVPGVSPGARAYIVRNIAFIGATLERTGLPSRWLAERPSDIPRGLQRLVPHAFEWLAASTFVRDDGHAAIDALLVNLNQAAFAAVQQ